MITLEMYRQQAIQTLSFFMLAGVLMIVLIGVVLYFSIRLSETRPISNCDTLSFGPYSEALVLSALHPGKYDKDHDGSPCEETHFNN